MYKVLLYHYRDNFDTDFPTEADRTLYNDASPDNERTILNATGKNSITELPTFDFTILPNHPLYNEIVKFKTWITVYCGSGLSDFDVLANQYLNAISSSSGLHEACGRLMKMLFESGNVDLLNRPQVPAEDLSEAGWEEPGEGTATIFGTSYSLGTDGVNFPVNAIIHLTPIKADGSVLSPSALDSYVDYLVAHATTLTGLANVDKLSNGGKGLLLSLHSVTGSWSDAYSFADMVDECLHELQAIYYLDDTSETPSESDLRTIAQTLVPSALAVHNVRFHGRVITSGDDFYGQRTVSCEGALGCLLDSTISPMSAVTETPKAHLQKIISAHNSQMSRTPYPEPYKCFTVGNVTITEANSNKKFEKVEGYSQTRSLIDDHLINDYKGYLFARYDGGTLYLDWLKEFNRVNDQPVKMAVNMLDRTIEENADDYYTVLLPIGQNNTTIDGTYLQDTNAIKQYGRIYKAESFDAKKKADLLSKAQKEFNKRGTNLPLSVHVKAVDMSLLGGNVNELLAGDRLTNVEDRTGALFNDLTIAEHNYDIFNPANDEFVVENQEAIDKRHTSSGNGTISSRAGRGGKDLFDDTRDLYRNYRNLTLKVDDTYSLNANTIYEKSKYHKIITGVFDLLADESNVRTETDNIKTVKFKTFNINHTYGPGDYVRRGDKTYMFTGAYPPGMGWEAAVEQSLVTETSYGESIDVKSIYGTHTHQDESGTLTVIQDVTGIELTKERPEIKDFDANTEYKEDDYVRYNDKIFRCLYPHKGKFNGDHFSFVADKKDESTIWSYKPVYKTDELGNTIMNLITGEAEYDIVDGNLEGAPVTNPIKSITRRTQTEFYDVIGTTDTYQSVTDEFSPTKSYAVGKGVKHNGKFYRFIAKHPGSTDNPLPWDWTHVEPLTETTVVNGEQLYTLTSVNGSTLFHNEKEIDQIVGEVEVVQTKDADGKVVSKDLVIKNGGGIRSRKDGVEVGIFENGQLNAGLMVNSLNSNSDTIKAMQFSESRVYEFGDYVQYGGKIYRCIVKHSKTAWNASHFIEASGKIAKLKADVVDLGDYATVGELNAKTVRVENLFAKTGTLEDIYAGIVYAEELQMDGGTIFCENLQTSGTGYIETAELDAQTILLGETDMADAIVSIAEDAAPPSGKIGFTYTTAGGDTGKVNFNIASTQTYLDGVEAAKKSVTLDSTGWRYDADENDMYLQVTASSPNTNFKTIYLPSLRHTITGNNVSIEARDKDANYHEVHSLTVPSSSGTITNIDYSGGDPVYDNNGGYDFNVKASGTNITGVGPYSLHLDATDAVEHGENSVVPVTAVTSGAVATSNAKAEKGNVTYTGNGSIGLIFYFTLSNGKKYKYSTSVSVGATAYDPRTYTLKAVRNSDGSTTNLSAKKFYFYKNV